MKFPLYIAKRYIFSKSSNNAITIINRIASLGIIVGTMALFVVLSVFSGLKEFSLSFTNEIDPDLKIESAKGKSFEFTAENLRQIKGIEGIESYTKVIEERVLFVFKNKQQVTYLKGVDENYQKVSNIQTRLFSGTWLKPETFQVVVGFGICRNFSMGILDFENPLQIFAPKPGKGTIDSPEEAFNKTEVLPVGIYSISEDLDSKYVFADLQHTQELLQYKPNQISAIEFDLKPDANEKQISQQLAQIFKQKIVVKNRAQLNASLYKMLNTENIAVYLIFTLVIIVALFNLIGALIMMILDKKQNLKTLFNLGTEIRGLRQIFLLQGTLLSFFGGLIGLVLGIILVLLQQHFELVMITPTLAYPVVFSFENVIIVMITILILGFLASLIASSRVSNKLLH
ncbi:FtsX-like permease family protein [Flavobacterium agrisoli]|uniref:ABC transporter permease n=1 Tax=Flavobacterium agrisoli TaxID=2793066 RepID=A0A934PLJ6_9FLAO|nr:FtsX-like permease family protein [Flavobacterium agrisoli]MBK0369549.1 ABC transporter permease [Flavobacterium agrisoli]